MDAKTVAFVMFFPVLKLVYNHYSMSAKTARIFSLFPSIKVSL